MPSSLPKIMRPGLMALALAATAHPALAATQDPGLAPRVDKLEKEMRAVQRKVFPGGAGQTVEPQISPSSAPPAAAGVPASSPVADLTARVNSLEEELARVTGQSEANGFKLRQLEEQFARFKGDADARLRAVESGGAAGAPAAPSRTPAPDRAAPIEDADTSRAPPARTPPSRPQPSDATSSSSAAPTGDPAEDAYLAGYRLWSDKKYPEAVTALRAVVAKYPNSKRASYAQNLLGRALLDDGQPAKAAKEFYTNYQTMPRGERAPDSLYYLGQSLMALKPPKPADACKVYGELLDVYGASIAGSLKDKVTKGQADAKCK